MSGVINEVSEGFADAVVAVQKCVRAFVARKKFLKMRRGIVRLQALFRGFRVRRKVRRMHMSASTIQTRYRRFKRTRQDRASFLHFKKAASVIQNEWRRWKFRQGIISTL